MTTTQARLSTSPTPPDVRREAPEQLLRRRPHYETRSAEQLREQYVVERELADRLRTASRQERRTLYASAYEELFRRIPHHTQLTKKTSVEQRLHAVGLQMRLLSPWLTPRTVFLEVGAGDCALSFAVAPKVAHVYAVDVSETITRSVDTPRNFTLLLSDGTSIPAPKGSVTLAYSNQLMEHLHPDDALEQLRNIYDVLAPGGMYICLTPSRLTGPHDISRYFEDVASGFHLREYTCTELMAMFKRVGFRSVQQHFRRRGALLKAPTFVIKGVERTLHHLPDRWRARATDSSFARGLLDIRLFARK